MGVSPPPYGLKRSPVFYEEGYFHNLGKEEKISKVQVKCSLFIRTPQDWFIILERHCINWPTHKFSN